MIVDLDDIARRAAEAAVAKCEERFDERIEAAVRRLGEQSSSLTDEEAAKFVRKSTPAWRMFVRRHKELEKLALQVGDRRLWRRSSLEEFFSVRAK